MGIDADNLILRPFREVVQQGQNAVSKSGLSTEDPGLSEQMAEAGQALVREGERALKRLQPIWDHQVTTFGAAFIDAILAHDDIEKKRRLLEDLLYDFEDFAELDLFDQAKFTQLQTATKSLALDVLDFVRRRKLDATKVADAPTRLFPPLPPLPPTSADKTRSGSVNTPRAPRNTDRLRKAVTMDTMLQLSMDKAKRLHGLKSGQSQVPLVASAAKASIPSLQGVVEVPSRNPISEAPTGTREQTPKTPKPPKTPISNGDPLRNQPLAARRLEDEWAVLPRTSSLANQQAIVPRSPHPRSPNPRGPTPGDTFDAYAGISSRPGQSRLTTLPPENMKRPSPVLTFRSDTSRALTGPRSSVFSAANSRATTTSDISPPVSPLGSPAGSPLLSIKGHAGALASGPPSPPEKAWDVTKREPLIPMPPITLPLAAFDEGLDSDSVLRSETSTSSPISSKLVAHPSQEDTHRSKIGPRSSFYRLNGFCRGAESFRVDGHWRAVRRCVEYFENKQRDAAKCVSCGYSDGWEEVRQDIEKRPEGSLFKLGARFRARLLYKSHMTTASKPQLQAQGMYGCLFCVQTGSTAREGDATVFHSADDLLLHLVRHPQPLPRVPGVTVLYGETSEADPYLEDFDIHFLRDPLPSPTPPDLDRNAVATSLKEHMQRYREKNLPRPPVYGGELLEFHSGARIVGITFPKQWEGKWCTGWHDGKHGAFPAKVVEIGPPRQSEIPMESNSGVSVTSRWKWKPGKVADGNERSTLWLEFEKGETISNVRCLYADHWCWWGTNSKGKYGAFPSSHIIQDTVQKGSLGLIRGPQSTRPSALFKQRPGSSSTSSNPSGGL